MNRAVRKRSFRAGVALAAVLGLAAMLALQLSGGDALTLQVIAAGPEGEDVGLLDPVRLTFDRSVPHRSTERAVKFSPSVNGSFTWYGNVLEFRPDAPGYARSTEYRVRLAGNPDDVLVFHTAGDLRAVRRAPDDGDTEVATDAALLVQFNASVQPLTTLADTPNRPAVRIEPAIEGTGAWLTSSMFRFRPANGWQPSTRYTVTIDPDLRGLEDETVAGVTSWSFTTISPIVAEVFPAEATTQAATGGTPGVPPRPDMPPRPPSLSPAGIDRTAISGAITVRFNQPVDREAAERGLSLAPPVSGTFAWPDDATMVLTPSAPLLRATRYTGTVAAGIPSANGQAATAAAFTWSFTTAGPPALTGSAPRDGETAAQIGGVTLHFATPMDRRSVEERITIEPKPEDDVSFNWQSGETTLYIYFRARPSSDYRLTLASGALDRFGLAIEKEHSIAYRTAPLPAYVSLLGSMGNGGVFRAGSTPRAVFSAVNTASIDLELYQLTQDQFTGMLWNNSGPPRVPSGAVSLRTWRQEFGGEPNRRQNQVVDLSDAPLPPGFYLLWTSASGRQYLPFIVTRTHLTLRQSWNGLLVWALDYDTGRPLADFAVRVLGVAGPAATARTDANGLATIPGYTGSAVVGERAGDVVFALTQWSAGYRTNGHVYPPSLLGSLTTDRPVYRSGETVYYQGIVRRDDDAALSVPAEEVTIRISDARGREIVHRSVKPDEFGSFDGSLALDAAAPTGSYQIAVHGPGGFREGMFTWASFQVAEFRRPEFFTELKAARDDYANGETIDLTASAELFFGAPMTDSAVRWRVTAEPYHFHSADFPGYSFADTDERFRAPTFGARLEGRGRTDSRGAFPFTVPADVSGDSTSMAFTVEATVTDLDNQEVSASTRVRVHKAARSAGVRPRGYIGTAGTPLTADLVTVDVSGQPAGNEALTVRFVHRRWLTVKVRDAEGVERYESKPEDREIEAREVRTGPDGRASVTFTPRTGGYHRFVVEGRDAAGNGFRAGIGVYVTGSGYIPWYVSDDDHIELVADKTEYRPGDVARVLVPAPFAGAIGLVTVERGGVLSKQVRIFAGNSEVLEIPIERRYLPNVFLSVTLFKPPTADNPLAELRSGKVELTVSAEEQRLHITLTPDMPKLGPRESVTFAVRTTDASGNPVPAQLSLALVDEAVLSLSDAKPSDAFATLYGKRQHGVHTSATHAVSLDAVAEKARALAGGEGKGGGGGEEFARSDFRFTAHWEPSLRTDANGNGTLTVRMPDTLTTWRLTARGVTTDSKAGMTDVKVLTRRPLIVRPVRPRFFTTGDEASLGAIVHNFTDAPLDVRVALTGEGLTLRAEHERTVRIPAGERASVTWKSRAETPGTARLRWSAAGGGFADAVELTLPVHAFGTPEAVATSGTVADRAMEVVRGPSTPGAKAEQVTLELLPSLTAALPSTVKWVVEYPYECAEQTSSRMLTTIGVAQAQGRTPNTNDLVRWIQRLYSEQHADGGWGWWARDSSDPLMTAYVVMALTAARDAGQTIDSAVLARAALLLGRELDRTRDVREDMNPSQRALLTYALVSADGGQIVRAFALAERRDVLGPEAKALLALSMLRSSVDPKDARLRPLLNDLLSSAVVSASAAHWEDSELRRFRLLTPTRTTAFAVWALARADAQGPLVDQAIRWLMNERREGRWSSTQESALVVLALGAVAEARGESAATYTYHVTLNGAPVHDGRIARAGDATVNTIAMGDRLTPGDNRLLISREPGNAGGRLYYQLNYRYATPAASIGAKDRGVAVAREILPADGSGGSLSRVKAGDLVMVRVTLLANSSMNYVMVEDFLPAGLEPVDSSLKTTTREVEEKRREEAERQAKRRGGSCRIGWYACYSPFTHVDIRDDRVALFARSVPRGAHEYVYFARATTPGTYTVRPSVASEVYFPDVWGRTDSSVFVVEP